VAAPAPSPPTRCRPLDPAVSRAALDATLTLLAGRGYANLRVADVADRLLASPSGMTRLADRLVAKGLIGRQVPDDNRRVVRVTLTQLGREALEAADLIFHDFLEHSFTAALTEEEVGLLRSLLRKLLEHNAAWAPDRPGSLTAIRRTRTRPPQVRWR
jgi:DNA-binding MarR family transcriptional regulator